MYQHRFHLASEWTYGLLGVFLGVGAPIGEVLLRISTSELVREAPIADIRSHLSFYGYQLIGTSIVFGLAGIAAGRRAEKLRRAEQFYHRLSEHDSLTGLLNARAFGERCGRAMQRGARLDQAVSMMLIDVDGLKQLNDQFGHAAGNDALIHVATVINRAKRSEDAAARWGGDEFAILLEGAETDAAARVAEAILATLRATPLTLGRQQRVVTVTVGIATAHQPLDPESLFAAADHALYDGKGRGRNCIATEIALPFAPDQIRSTQETGQ